MKSLKLTCRTKAATSWLEIRDEDFKEGEVEMDYTSDGAGAACGMPITDFMNMFFNNAKKP